jgi:hypothetical protein
VICFLAGEGAKDLRGAAIPVYGSLWVFFCLQADTLITALALAKNWA